MADLRLHDRVRIFLEADEFKLITMALTGKLQRLKGSEAEIAKQAIALAHKLLGQHEKALAERLEAATGATEAVEALLEKEEDE